MDDRSNTSSPIDLADRQVWIKAFWGFSPHEDGYLGFTKEGDRRKFLGKAKAGDLVLIYGADAPETQVADRRQALGFLEIDPVPIADKVKMSSVGAERKRVNGWLDRWTFAVPVRRAWRVNRRIEVKHIAPRTYSDGMFRTIANRGAVLDDLETRTALQLPVSEVAVFGEPALTELDAAEYSMGNAFEPSRGVVPFFGTKTVTTEDGDHYLYLMTFEGDTARLLGRRSDPLWDKGLFKVGLSRDPARRCGELNAGLPPASKFRWSLSYTSKAFPNGQLAKTAEDDMKAKFAGLFESQGGEFFLGKPDEVHSAFFVATSAAAFVITATKGASAATT